jgi:hypothetical protein
MLTQLRRLDSVVPVDIAPGDSIDIRKAPGNAVYGFADANKLADARLRGPILVRRDQSAEFNLEVHRVGASIEVVGYLAESVAKAVLAGQPLPLFELGIVASSARRCVMALPVDRIRAFSYEPGWPGGAALVIQGGIVMERSSLPTVRCEGAAAP